MTIALYQLDSSGARHAQAMLERTNAIGHQIAAQHSLHEGRIYAVVPEGSDHLVYDFDSAIHRNTGTVRAQVPGGHVERVPSTEATVSAWIGETLRSQKSNLFVAESFLLRASDIPRIGSSHFRVLTCGDFVYHAVCGEHEQMAVDAVLATVYETPLGVGIMAHLDHAAGAWLRGRSTLSEEDLRAVAQGTTGVLIGAYDGESVLIWLPKDSPLRLPSW